MFVQYNNILNALETLETMSQRSDPSDDADDEDSEGSDDIEYGVRRSRMSTSYLHRDLEHLLWCLTVGAANVQIDGTLRRAKCKAALEHAGECIAFRGSEGDGRRCRRRERRHEVPGIARWGRKAVQRVYHGSIRFDDGRSTAIYLNATMGNPPWGLGREQKEREGRKVPAVF
jgi:hypothetical protein